MGRIALAASLLALCIGCGGRVLEDTGSDGGLDATKPDATGDAMVDVTVKPDAPPPPTCSPKVDGCGPGTYCGNDGNGTFTCIPGCKGDPDCGGAACCAHQCADTTTDAKNCGACGSVCNVGSCCSSSCTDTETSLANCGGCGKTCAPSNVIAPLCKGGTCVHTGCTAGFGDCDGVFSNGCETDVTTDAKNCGVCGLNCPSGATCVNSTCVVSSLCGPNDVSFQGHCYYLDGSGGNCDAGFTRASEVLLAQIATMFQGKNYRHVVSQNCCIWTSDVLENYGMMSHCNSNGPFSSGEPAKGAVGCTAQQIHGNAQLTFCGN